LPSIALPLLNLLAVLKEALCLNAINSWNSQKGQSKKAGRVLKAAFLKYFSCLIFQNAFIIMFSVFRIGFEGKYDFEEEL
jgi:hypothetical protein